MLACPPARCNKLKRQNIDRTRIAGRSPVSSPYVREEPVPRSKIVGQTQVLPAPLINRLPRKCEPHPLSSFVVMVNDEIVPFGPARKKTVNQLRLEQLF